MGTSASEQSTALVDSTVDAIPTATSLAPAPLKRGDCIGRYAITAILGRGGMGVVYAAFDPQLGRKVALKIIRPDARGSTSAGNAQARLLREAQAMAGLSHPNVIPIYDVGQSNGVTYIAMELIVGQSLRAWFSGQRPWPAVLQVMVAAGRGLVAAHTIGIVHRDFKPGNVLLGEDGRVRVLDFGLACDDGPGGSIEPSGLEHSGLDHSDESSRSRSSRLPHLTEAGTVVGTPTYMAPEHAAGDPVDARSDQFSFCVALYEGLYGETPFAGKHGRTRTRNIRLGRIREAPPNSKVPARVRRWVVRGLSPDPARRWPSLAHLLDTLDRATGRKRTAAVLLAATTLATGAVGATFAFGGDRCSDLDDEIGRAWNADTRARVETAFERSGAAYSAGAWTRVAERVDAFARDWSAVRSTTCRADDIDPRGRDQRLACLSRRRAELEALVDVLEDADDQVVRHAVQSANRLGDTAECEAPADTMPQPPPHAAARVQQIREDLSSIAIYCESHRYERALEVGRAALSAATELDYAPLLAEVLSRHGQTENNAGDYASAGEHLERAYYLAQESGHDALATRAATELLFMYGSRQGDAAAAEVWRGHADAASGRLGEDGTSARAEFLQASGAVALRQADFDRAHSLLSKGLELSIEARGEETLQAASITGNLGVADINRGRFDEARRRFERARELSQRLLGPGHPDVASWHNNLGVLAQNQGDHEASLESFRRAYDIESAIFGDRHQNTAMSLNNMGGALIFLDRTAEATDYLRRSIAAYEAVEDYDPIDLARPMANLGRALSNLGDHEEGARHLRRALGLIEDSSGPDHPELGSVCINLGSAYEQLGRYDEALALMRRALEIDRASLGPTHPFVGASLGSIAELHLVLGEHDKAEELLEEAFKIQVGGDGDPEHLAATKFSLARALWPKRHDRERAISLTHEAEQELVAVGISGADRLADLRAWKRKHGVR